MTQTNTPNSAAASTTSFGLALFKEEARQNKGKNVLISPASVAIALAMTMNGARQTTLSAMQSTLGFGEGETIDTINASMEALLSALTDPKSGVELTVANAIWAEQSMPFKKAFLEGVVAAYKARVVNADFADPATVDAINKWADENTRGKIPTIIDDIAADMVMYLLNAIYFKGSWTTKFDKDMTFGGQFASEADGEVSVMYMNREADMRYSRGQTFQAVALPFGESKRVSLYVLLPNEGVDINDFVEGLSASVLTNLQGSRESEVDLRLPRFKAEYDVDLKDSLCALGMGEAFQSGADFTGMADADMVISTVKHKTFAKFDEDGGEAAAVTAVGMALECVRRTPQVHVTRPFVAALVDEVTGALLFIGKVAKPD
ncbi:MAG: serpin family protein [Candidatus Melainabacteria bacterium]|nr:serpin family protein [Candidatus Melainabacteria bacterium]